MMTKGGASPGHSVQDLADWGRVSEDLEAGQYQQAAEILGQAQAAIGPADPGLVQILAAAGRICLACSQSQAEAEWHQRAYQEADQREQELTQQLQALLDLVMASVVFERRERREEPSPGLPPVRTDLPGRDIPDSPERAGPWQRIQKLLGRRVPSPSLEREPPKVLDVAPSPSFPEKTEMLAAPPGMQTEAPTASLVTYCLGPFRVFQNDQPITEWNSSKAKSIFKYVLANPEARIAKEVLMDIFWPDATPMAARRNLHQAIYSLRQILRGEQPDFQHIRFEDDCYLLNPEMDVWLDFREFEKHVQDGQRMEAAGRLDEAMAEYGMAESLYQGDFLEEDLYEDWPRVQREHMRSTYLDMVDRLSDYYVGRSEYTTAVALCQKVLAQDNCYEKAHYRLMRCYLAQDQRHLAVRQYQNCVEVLKQELDLTPSEETVALYRRITTTTYKR